ncbi:MAG: FimV/HubP family polar landmark protein [Pseudohongiella sp.]|nr:FimV/HubP family polar landmark protein [Pseudohongiella sp.]
MVKRWLPSVATLSSLSMALLMMAPADAVELGNISLQSASGQPLVATVQLSDTDGLNASQINVQVASAADFERFSLERLAALDTLQIEVDFSGRTPVLRVSSPVTINEPFVSLVLDTRWPSGRVLTEYTLRLESPAFSAQTGAPASSAPIRSVQEPLAEQVAEAPAVAVPETTASVSNAPVSSQAAAAQSSPATSPASPQPGFASQQAAAPQPAATVSNASTITVNAGDTLWELAQRVRPDSSVSVQQTMLALQRLNPQAFIGGNINRVRRGEILQVPELSQIRQLAATEAVSEVNRQNQQLAAGASAVAAQPVTSAPSAAPGAGAQGELRVVTVADDADNQQADASAAGNQSTQRSDQIESLEDRISLGEEDLARLDAQNSELNARLALLQQQIASAQEIIRLRDLELAQLQQRLSEETGTASADTPPTVITMAPDAGPFQRLMHILTSNTWAMLAAAGVLVLLLVLLMVRRNRAAAESKAQASARENDGMSLGSEDDELLFSGVAEAAAESAASSAAAAEETASNEEAAALYKLVEESSDPDADPELDKQIYNNKVQQEFEEGLHDADSAEPALPQATDLSEPEMEDDWQPGELSPQTAEFDARFELDETADNFDDTADADVLSREFNADALDNPDSDELSSEDTGADLDWPDEDKAAKVGDEFDISLPDDNDPLAEDVSVSAPEQVSGAAVSPEPASTAPQPPEPATNAVPLTKSTADDFDDLAFLPSEDDFTDQADAEDEEDFDFLSDSDESATKLDLARAYIDMGDGHGAREILEEVLSEGTEAQRKEAQDLLGRL